MNAAAARHILVVTVDPEDPERLRFEVECPGVTDECREYRDCLADAAEQAALEKASDDGDDLYAHGKLHMYINYAWMAETDSCYLQDHDGLPDEADGRFPVGRHPIGWDVGDGTEIEIYAVDGAVEGASR